MSKVESKLLSKKSIGDVPKTDVNKMNSKIIYQQGGKSFAFQKNIGDVPRKFSYYEQILPAGISQITRKFTRLLE